MTEYIKINFGKLSKHQLIIILSIIHSRDSTIIIEKTDGCRVIMKKMSDELISEIYNKIESFLSVNI